MDFVQQEDFWRYDTVDDHPVLWYCSAAAAASGGLYKTPPGLSGRINDAQWISHLFRFFHMKALETTADGAAVRW